MNYIPLSFFFVSVTGVFFVLCILPCLGHWRHNPLGGTDVCLTLNFETHKIHKKINWKATVVTRVQSKMSEKAQACPLYISLQLTGSLSILPAVS